MLFRLCYLLTELLTIKLYKMTKKELTEKILRAIPVVGVSLIGVIIFCIIYAIWSNEYEYAIKTATTSLISILVLIGIEKSIE